MLVNPPEKMRVDHIDGNPLNNQRSNLRLATPAQNKHNSRKRKATSSIYKGVSKLKNSWKAQITVHGKTTRLGKFETEKEAALAFDEAARKLQGPFAKLNFPKEGEQSATAPPPEPVVIGKSKQPSWTYDPAKSKRRKIATDTVKSLPT